MITFLAAALMGQVIYGHGSQHATDSLINRRVEQSYGVNFPRPKIISFVRGPQDWPGHNGVVTKIDRAKQLIYADLAVESVAFHYNERTLFRTLSGNYHRLAPGDAINADRGIITIIDQ